VIDRFRVPESEATIVTRQALHATVSGMFETLTVPESDAHQAADVLVAADLRGVDSHGVSNQLRSYLLGLINGEINPTPTWEIERESPSGLTINCDRGLGVIIAPKAMQMTIQKAEHTGVAMATLKNGRHLGMAGYHAMRALEHDMIGVCMSSTGSPLVLPTFGREARLGTNPIAIAVPTYQEPPFVLDMATSTIAANKIGLARRLGTLLAPGWIAGEDGTPLDHSVPAPPPLPGSSGSGYPPRLLPLGSTPEGGSYKGYGLACMVEILCGILSGDGFSMQSKPGVYRHMVAAYNVSAFTQIDQFKSMMDAFLHILKSTPVAANQAKVLVAGEVEAETERYRLLHGIPLHHEVVDWIRKTCKYLGSPFDL